MSKVIDLYNGDALVAEFLYCNSRKGLNEVAARRRRAVDVFTTWLAESEGMCKVKRRR